MSITTPEPSNISTPAHEVRTVVIRPSGGMAALHLGDLWTYRELIGFMTWRDVIVRYKQTFLGVAWAILRPFLSMVVFTIFFGNLAKVPSDGIPYPIFTYTALLPWELFSKALSDASRSLVQNSNMITKIYFPRMILPLASVPGRRGGFCDRVPGVDRDDALLPHRTHIQHYLPAAVHPTCPGDILWNRVVAFCRQRRISGCKLHSSLPDPDVDVYYTDRLLFKHGPGSVAGDLFPEPDGRSGEWLPLGAAGNRTACAYNVDLGGCGSDYVDQRIVLL